jgi:outer membrane protein assembly factor BamB
MTTSITSNSRPLLRALSAFVIAISTLWAMPKDGCAQIYVTNGDAVSEYKITGELLNANFITGLNEPTFLAIKDNNIFVSNAPGFPDPGFVGKYDVGTGGAVNPSFIVLSDPLDPRRVLEAEGLAVVGDLLFVVASSTTGDERPGYVIGYNAATGEKRGLIEIQGIATAASGLAGTFASLENFSLFLSNGFVEKSDNGEPFLLFIQHGPHYPTGLALSGNTLFVASLSDGTVGQYDATTLAVIKADFLAGLNGPQGLAVSGDKLFVVNQDNGTVGEYDANTGAVIKADLITGLNLPIGIAVRDLTKKHKK